jgi:hypothetical protein
VSRRRIAGPTFSENTINSKRYIDIVHQFLGHLTEGEIPEAQFQQDSAICLTTRATARELSLLFGDRIVLKGLWPPRSPDLSSPDICQRGFINDSDYRRNPRSPDEVKTNVSNITADISPMALQAMSTDMLRCARLCMQHAGAHFQKLL